MIILGPTLALLDVLVVLLRGPRNHTTDKRLVFLMHRSICRLEGSLGLMERRMHLYLADKGLQVSILVIFNSKSSKCPLVLLDSNFTFR